MLVGIEIKSLKMTFFSRPQNFGKNNCSTLLMNLLVFVSLASSKRVLAMVTSTEALAPNPM